MNAMYEQLIAALRGVPELPGAACARHPEQLYGLHLQNVVQLSERASARIAQHDTALRNMAVLGAQINLDAVGPLPQTARAQDMDFGAIRGEIEVHSGAPADPVHQRHKQCGPPAGACRGDRQVLPLPKKL